MPASRMTITDISFEDIRKELVFDKKLQEEIDDINLTYRSAIKEVTTKLEILSDNFEMQNEYMPIHHIESRLKTIDSLVKKAERYGIPDPLKNLPRVRAEVYDIAGVRVICNYRRDIYAISRLLLKQSDVNLIRVKDYCENPKNTGYRSLHVVISIPVFLVKERIHVPVELQFRSIAMDTWATLEHELRYKNNGELTEDIKDNLKRCAYMLANIDKQMEEIRKQVL